MKKACILTVLLLLFVPAVAQPQPAGTNKPHPSQSIPLDATQLDTIITLEAPWRFQTGDDPTFAVPSFDDTAWPLLQPGQTLASLGLPPYSGHYTWARLHLRIANPQHPVGIAFTTHDWQQYTVFANGRQIAASPGTRWGATQRSLPFAIPLPQTPDVVLAVRFLAPFTGPLKQFPLSKVQVAPLATITEANHLARLQDFDSRFLAGIIGGFAFLAFVPVMLVLYLAQRKHSEYIALAVFFLFGALFAFVSNADDAGLMPETLRNELAYQYLLWSLMLTGLEFVSRFTLVRRKGPLRTVQAMMLVMPLLYLGDRGTYGIILAGGVLIWLGFVTAFLISAFRKGKTESGLLVFPFAYSALVQMLDVAAFFFPARFPSATRIHLGHVGFDRDDLSTLIFISGILAVVLYRFIRVSRDEQHAAGELEAARNVQHILIPEDLPRIPGYTVTSVYQPAQQVGGDFFQVVPSPLDPGVVLVLLGDVSGKGLQAAMTVAVIVGAFRTMADYTLSPAELLLGLNRRLLGRGTGFTTGVALALTRSGVVIAANAGHLPPYLQQSEVGLEPGLPLGVTLDATYPETTFTLAPGEALTLLTDGVVEATDPATRELFGFDRTQAISAQTPQTIARAATAFGSPAAQADDITVLTISRDLPDPTPVG